MPLLFAAAFFALLSGWLAGEEFLLRRHDRLRRALWQLEPRELEGLHGEPVITVWRRGAAGALGRLLARVARRSGLAADAETERRLVWIGLAWTPEQFAALRLMACAGGVLVGVLAAAATLGSGASPATGCIGGLAGYLAPNAWLASAVRRRREAIDRELLYFLDFLGLAAQAGLSVDNAVEAVARELPGILSAAFAQVQSERGMGQWSEHALAGLATRLGHPDVQTVVDALIRAGRFGSETAGLLREVAAGIRRRRGLAAREHANRVGAAIVLPVAVFILPAIVVVLGYPAVKLMTAALAP